MLKRSVLGLMMLCLSSVSFASDAKWDAMVNASKSVALDLFVKWMKKPYRITSVESAPLKGSKYGVYTVVGYNDQSCDEDRYLTVSMAPDAESETGYAYGYKFAPCGADLAQ